MPLLEQIHRAEWARLVAALARRFGDLDIAEEAAAEAFAAAVEHWRDGPPPNPGGWLMTTATRRAVDRLRRERVRSAKYALLSALDPSPVVALNRAVVLAELDGPAVALAAVDRLALDGYHAWHAARAELLVRLGRLGEAAARYTCACTLAANPAERRYLARRRDSLAP